MNMTAAVPGLAGAALARSRKRRRRFLAAAIAGLVILGASLGVSFLGPSGTTSVSVTAGGSSNLVYPVATGASLPSAVTSLQYTTAADIASSTINTAVLPNWSNQIAAGSAGTVDGTSPDGPGDLAVIDATQVPNAAIVDMYITNLSDVQQAYSSFVFHVNIYSSPCTSNACTWTQASNIVGASGTYITNTSGFLSFSLPAGKYYDITMDTGGSFYTVSTTAGSLSPSYYFTAQSS